MAKYVVEYCIEMLRDLFWELNLYKAIFLFKLFFFPGELNFLAQESLACQASACATQLYSWQDSILKASAIT